MIPLILRLKREMHRSIAQAQDIIMEELYRYFPNAVLHGGTAIWRCFKGNRFSEDIDAYIKKDRGQIDAFFASLGKRGFVVEKKKIGENSIYSSLKFERTAVRFEAVFKAAKGSLKEYETADGNMMTIYTLTPEEFIAEKVEAYMKRLKARDMYDIFFLLRFVTDMEAIRKKLEYFIGHFKEPIDEKELKLLIIEGIVPSSRQMLDYIKRNIKYGERKIPEKS